MPEQPLKTTIIVMIAALTMILIEAPFTKYKNIGRFLYFFNFATNHLEMPKRAIPKIVFEAIFLLC
ncbi:hypothetical protein [Nitrosomonas ureae]|uniref:hypothetical protein n=1 Tax=Nitrosomonas ureae TaxID=44577 RepID=UPI0013965FD6|nr:hypothetical protein [Nitrosomonas ureae]